MRRLSRALILLAAGATVSRKEEPGLLRLMLVTPTTRALPWLVRFDNEPNAPK